MIASYTLSRNPWGCLLVDCLFMKSFNFRSVHSIFEELSFNKVI